MAAYLPPGSRITPLWRPPDKLMVDLHANVITDNLLLIDIPKDNATIDELGLKLLPLLEYSRPGDESRLIVAKIIQEDITN